MERKNPFDRYPDRYEDWFDRHAAAYRSELIAIRALLPPEGKGLEIGVGSGRFAAPLGIRFGVDPSPSMLAGAAQRGVLGARGTGEALPFRAKALDFALMVTVLCFMGDPRAALSEARRVIRPGGTLLIAFIDRESPLGKTYEAHKEDSAFYREARFFASTEVEALLVGAGFHDMKWLQTLKRPPEEMKETEPPAPGRGEGSFVVVRARKPSRNG